MHCNAQTLVPVSKKEQHFCWLQIGTYWILGSLTLKSLLSILFHEQSKVPMSMSNSHCWPNKLLCSYLYILKFQKSWSILFNWKLLSCEQLEIRFLLYTKPGRLTFIVTSRPMKSRFSWEHLVNSLLFFMPWLQLLLLWVHFD